MSVDFTYEKGALAEFLDELPDLILQYQQNQIQMSQRRDERAEDREWKEELEKTRQAEFGKTFGLQETESKLAREERKRLETRRQLEFEKTFGFQKTESELEREIRKSEREEDVAFKREELAFRKKEAEAERGQEVAMAELIASLDLKGAESQKYLEFNLAGINRDLETKKVYDERIASLGLTTESLRGVDEIYKSLDAIDIADADVDQLEQRRDAVDDQLDARLKLISDYHSGAQSAKDIDINNDWKVTDDEITKWEAANNAKVSEAFKHGINSYTANAEQMLSMVAQQVDITAKKADIATQQEMLKQLKIETEFLPDKYKTAQLKDDLQIDTGKLNLEILKDSKDQSKLVREGLKLDNQLKNQELAKIKSELENAQITKNEEMYTRYKTNLESIRSANIEKQAYAGASSLVDISIGSGRRKASGAFSTYKPFLSVIAETDVDIASLEKAFSSYPSISDDLIDMYNAYNMGVSEDQIANYQLVLEQMQQINGYKNEYDSFMLNNKDALAVRASETGLPWNHRSVINSVANESNLTPLEVIAIKKKMEWNDTGVYDDMSKFTIIDNIINQNLTTQQIYENVLLHQHNVNTPADLPTGVIDIPTTLQGTVDSTQVNNIFQSIIGVTPNIFNVGGGLQTGYGISSGYNPNP